MSNKEFVERHRKIEKTRNKDKKEEDLSRLIKDRYQVSESDKQSREDFKRQKIEEYLAKNDDKKEEDKLIVYEREINNIKYKYYQNSKMTKKIAQNTSAAPVMIEVIVNDRCGRKERIKCFPSDTILNLKKLIAAKTGTRPDKIKLQKGNRVFNNEITLEDYEIRHGMGIEMYYS